MLLMTIESLYHLPLNPRGAEPARLMGGEALAVVAEGRRYHVMVLADNRLQVLEGAEIAQVDPGIREKITSLVIVNEEPLTLVLGTEPPQIYRLVLGGEPRISFSFANLKVRPGWHTPWGGPAAVRSLAVSRDGWLYADIHVGSIMRSADGGTIWEPVTPELHEDVHQVAVSQAAAKRVYANTANGLWTSRDRGESWAYLGDRLQGRYGRAVAVHPAEPNTILVTVSDGPHGDNVHGQLYRSRDAGYNWQLAEGFPQSAPHNIDTYQVAYDMHGDAWAVLGSTLYQGRFAGRWWEVYWEAPEPILMLSCYH